MKMSAEALRALPQHAASKSCEVCKPLVCRGWESLPSSFERSLLLKIGTLRDELLDDPTLLEFQPDKTGIWSADAPIAPAYFPYNRCDVWQCSGCTRAFLRYTEYGGYYEDDRIRELDTSLLDESIPPGP